MKKQYQKPQIAIDLLQSEPLMNLSQNGRTLTFDSPDIDGDAGNAASRTYNIWDEIDE